MVSKRVQIFLVFSLCFVLFTILCFYQLYVQDMEVVELLTSETARRSWMKLLGNRLCMGHPPLYFLMTKMMVAFFDHNQFSLYIFPILTGGIGIPLIYFLARELGMGKWSLLPSLFWSVHPSIIYYSRYIRPQIGVSVLCMGYLFVLLKNLEQPKIRNKFLLFCIGLIGALWSHLLLFFWLGILFASLFIKNIRRYASKEYWLTMVFALFSQVVVSVTVRAFSGSIQERLEWVKFPTFTGFFKVFIHALGAETGKMSVTGFMWLTPVLGILSFIIVFYFNNVKKVRLTNVSKIHPKDRWNLLLVSAVASIALFLGLTFTVQTLWVPRYLVILLPVVIVAMAQAAACIRWRYVAVSYASLIFISGIVNSGEMIFERNFGLRERISNLEKQYEPGQDIVLNLNIMTREALRLYTEKELDHFVIKRSTDQEAAFQVLEEKIKGKKRLWVLELPRKDSIIKTERWKPFERNRFYADQNKKVALFGYNLPAIEGNVFDEF